MTKISTSFKNSIITRLIASLILILSLLVMLSIQSLTNNSRTKTTLKSIEALNDGVIRTAVDIEEKLFRLIVDIKRVSEQTNLENLETVTTSINNNSDEVINLIRSIKSEIDENKEGAMLTEEVLRGLEVEVGHIRDSAEKASIVKATSLATVKDLSKYRIVLSDIDGYMRTFFDDLYWEVDDDQSLIILKEFYASFLVGINFIKDIPSSTTIDEVDQSLTAYMRWKASHQEQFLTVATVVARYPDFRESVVRLTDLSNQFDAVTIGVDEDALDSIYELSHQLITTKNAINKEIINTESLIPAAISNVNQLKTSASDQGHALSSVLSRSIVSSDRLLVLATSASFLIVVGVSVFLVTSIKRPLLKIVTCLDNLGKGNLSYQYGQHTNDEFGLISKGLEGVINNLNELVSTIVGDSKHLNTLSQSSTENMDITNEQVSVQSEKIESAATAMEQLSNSVSEVSNEANGTKKIANDVHQLSNSGIEKMSTSKSEMAELNSHLENTLNVVSAMSASVENIEKILMVIKNIAEQTNLLALNAAIEAARAGEQGRGFAVVADEVRGLATRTQQSTSEIQTYIEDLNQHSSRAVSAMSKSKDLSDGANLSFDLLADVMQQLKYKIDDLNQSGTRINNITSEQHNASESISQDVRDVADSGRVVNDSMTNLKGSVDELLSISDSLRQSTSKFQLS